MIPGYKDVELLNKYDTKVFTINTNHRVIGYTVESIQIIGRDIVVKIISKYE